MNVKIIAAAAMYIAGNAHFFDINARHPLDGTVVFGAPSLTRGASSLT
jgi:hypothetical protein